MGVFAHSLLAGYLPACPLDCRYMVVNGATKYGDMKHFDERLAAFRAKGGDVSYEYLHSQNLVALQVRREREREGRPS